ncbi:PASTA domain-containing protein [Arthrobacter sp. GMC3]|uniref:PASTA domain-containing protein n=1 Tax=Arthrobacter sp. GMC3 TaxID=2058894 RepID=UPI0015E3B5FC|nr:PASTA domain-containing protein [Arthrobacter sp. GMC3]
MRGASLPIFGLSSSGIWPLAPSTDPPTTAPTTAPDALQGGTLLWALVIIAVVVLFVSLFVLWARLGAGKPAPDSTDSMIRSWVAAILVVGLLLLTALSFGLKDTTLRSALVGGITASVGAAIAFYFSAKSADAARQDVLKAATGTEQVPDLVGTIWADAIARLGTTSFKLVQATPSATAIESRRQSLMAANQGSATEASAVQNGPSNKKIVSQDPAPNSSALKGSNVTVHFE